IFAAALHLGLAEPVVRTLTFSTLVMGNLALIFTNRSMNGTGLVQSLAPNRAMRLLAGVALLMLGLVLYVPALRDLFRLTSPTAAHVAACAASGLLTIIWVETVKAIDVMVTTRSAATPQRS